MLHILYHISSLQVCTSHVQPLTGGRFILVEINKGNKQLVDSGGVFLRDTVSYSLSQ